MIRCQISSLEWNSITGWSVFFILRPEDYWQDLERLIDFSDSANEVILTHKVESIRCTYLHHVKITSIDVAKDYHVDQMYLHYKKVCHYQTGNWIAYWFRASR